MGLGLSLGNEIGKEKGQAFLSNAAFTLTAGTGTLSNSTPKGFTFATANLSTMEVSTTITVPNLTSGSYTAEYRYYFDITERTGDLAQARSIVGSDTLSFSWGASYTKSNYDSGGTRLYLGGDETVEGNFTEGGEFYGVTKHTHSSWPSSLTFKLVWAGAPATRTITIDNFRVQQVILSTS